MQTTCGAGGESAERRTGHDSDVQMNPSQILAGSMAKSALICEI